MVITTLCSQLIAVSNAYGLARGIGRQRVSTIVLNRGSTLDRIADGVSDINTATHERAMKWFSNHWPEGLDWPEGVLRPEPEKVVEAAE